MPGDGGGRGDGGRHQVGASAAALASLEVAVRGGGAALAGGELVGVHGQAHGAARLAPVEPCGAEHLVEALGLPGPKAVGGITGAIGRWGPARGVTLPYEAITLAGERAWRWIADGKPAPLPSARELGAQVLAKDESDPIDALLDALPDVPQRLLELIREKGQVPVPDVLNTLGLAKAQALSSHLRVIANKATQLGLAVPYERTTSPTGESGFRWLAGRAGGQVLPFKDREPESESDDDGARPDLAGAGVRRRRGSRAG